MSLERKLNERTARAAVIGLGYVGLPQALAMAQAGFRTTGVDVDGGRVANLVAGHSHIEDVAPPLLRRLLRARRFTATTDFGALGAADVITICVPTPLSTRTPSATSTSPW
jgi:UDP-N-acetyl-D-glucosamine dehydrogenase